MLERMSATIEGESDAIAEGDPRELIRGRLPDGDKRGEGSLVIEFVEIYATAFLRLGLGLVIELLPVAGEPAFEFIGRRDWGVGEMRSEETRPAVGEEPTATGAIGDSDERRLGDGGVLINVRA